ncbi:hypothetical protein F8M41_020148 [Gigaspora margarita]|uniref:Uncharacterized protein n=1 Tax=Gigaspora margarita TaxID=4874 RepID=A0A8H4AIU7_GIGMA|nr:hypothetical protein F8M41_020148 [Gigaspora margarita]
MHSIVKFISFLLLALQFTLTCSKFIQPTYEVFSNNRSSLSNRGGFQIIQPKPGSYFPLGSNQTIIWDYPIAPNPEIYVTITANYRDKKLGTEVVFNKTTTLYPSNLTYKIEEIWSTNATYNVIIQIAANPSINVTSGPFYVWESRAKSQFIVQCFMNILVSVMYINI